MKRRTFIKSSTFAGLVTLITPTGLIQAKEKKFSTNLLAEKFRVPPSSAKPHTWWHWMNGNITKEGITLDLESMARVGIGGFQNFDAGTGIPKGPVQYLSSEWLELKKHAIKEAERLELEFTMHNCPGWSSTGGPWISPDLSMMQVTWSEIFVKGGQKGTINLPLPFSKLEYYKDIVVLAYPSMQGEGLLKSSLNKVFTNTGIIDIDKLLESNDSISIEPKEDGNQAYLQFDFKKSHQASFLTFIGTPSSSGNRASIPIEIMLQSSEDGIDFRDVVKVMQGGQFGGSEERNFFTIEFPTTEAKYYRLVSNRKLTLEQIRLSGIGRFEDWKKRTNFSYNGRGLKELSNSDAIPVESIINVTAFIDKNTLKWKVPEGNWTIMRIGFTSLGTLNRSAPDTGIGLECDKYSSKAMDFHFNKMMENLLPSLKSLGEKGKVGLLIDSYEVGMQNWTPGFEEEFERRNNYNLIKYLPALTGRLVGSKDLTERFLWDFRRTQGDMMADNYYGKFKELCHENNMLAYIQPYDRGPMEEMQIGSRIDINVGEFWNGLSSIFQNNWTMRRTVKLSAAIAHTNSQKIIAAESFTGEPGSAKWQEYPFGMKALGDKMFTQGLNRVVFHRFAHQPHPTAKPGMTMGPWGIHFDRTNTWWEQGKVWMEYLSRCQYMLQEGLFVADIAYFTGEDAGVYTKVLPEELVPSPPDGYDYDLINAEVILNKVKVVNNRLTLPDGTNYLLLVLQNQETMTLKFLQKLSELVKAGLVVVGTAPKGTPGMKGFNNDDKEFKSIVRELWGDSNTEGTINKAVGKGKVMWGQSLEEILMRLDLRPDFDVSSRSGDAPVTFIHRRQDDTDIYFIANQRRKYEELLCTFRVKDKRPELWDPLTGKTLQLPVFDNSGDCIKAPVTLGEFGSMFIIFRSAITAKKIKEVRLAEANIISINPFPVPPKKDYKDVVNNFTISVWAKPETEIMLNTQNFMDWIPQPWTDNYAIYPASGEKLYGEGHAISGLTIGRNGVVVWEREKGKPIFRLPAAISISGWSHVALVYDDGTPSIYVNGKLIEKGNKSSYKMHPPGEGMVPLKDDASFYNGDITILEIFAEVITQERISEIALKKPTGVNKYSPLVEATELTSSGLLFWENGDFSIKGFSGKTSLVKIEDLEKPINLTDSWTVFFPSNTGAPSEVKLSTLAPLNEQNEEGVKYFSGTATYTRTFNITKKTISGNKRFQLDLGQVEVIAEITLNGKDMGTLWSRPFKVDITEAIKEGKNLLEIKVTNLWPNRLIGDEQKPEVYKYSTGGGGSGFGALSGGAILELPDWYKEGRPKTEDGRVAFATWKHYKKDSPLLESGLIGPVMIRLGIIKELNLKQI